MLRAQNTDVITFITQIIRDKVIYLILFADVKDNVRHVPTWVSNGIGTYLHNIWIATITVCSIIIISFCTDLRIIENT